MQRVARLTPDQLTQLALDAVEEAAAASHAGPVPRTRALAVSLAWLLHFSKAGDPPPRWPFASFWEGLSSEREHNRWSAVNAAVNAIYLNLGLARSSERQSRVERRARQVSLCLLMIHSGHWHCGC
jgi:hypothetical protein